VASWTPPRCTGCWPNCPPGSWWWPPPAPPTPAPSTPCRASPRSPRGTARSCTYAAYGGGLLFSKQHSGALDGLQSAVSVTVDLHKLGWQPVAAGLLAVPDGTALRPLAHQAEYLNAADDTEAGLPDLLGRSLRTTRRPDILKLAVTVRALGREGIGALVDAVCERARELAAKIESHPGLTLYAPPTISTVLFRPTRASDEEVARLRRTLLYEGRAVLGRARGRGRLWLKATLLNPHARSEDLDALIQLSTEGTPAR